MAEPGENWRIWKHSHGTNKTTPDWSNEDREQFKADQVLKIFANTTRGQIPNFKSMRPGDFFLLCHGNDIQLLGQVSNETPKLRADPLERRYTVVRRLEGGPWKFKGHKKGWSPAGNTTCWPVRKGELGEFQNDILEPFFGMTLDDLLGWKKPTRGQLKIESAELPPSTGPLRPYKPPRGDPLPASAGESVRLFDPDKTGRRARSHDKCLERLAKMLDASMRYASKKGYDLVVPKNGKVLLVEAKTIRGDAAHQLRLALGQLLYYQHVLVEPRFPQHRVFRAALTDRVPPKYLVDLLEKYHVGVVSARENQRVVGSKLGRRFLKMFGVDLEPQG